MRMMALATASLAALALSMPASSGAQEAETSPQGSCEAVATSLAIYGGVTHTSSRMVPAGPGQAAPGAEAPMLPEHCLVEGTINQRTGFGGVEYGIGFELRLPSDWNGRFLL